jgi:hypothetical protein
MRHAGTRPLVGRKAERTDGARNNSSQVGRHNPLSSGRFGLTSRFCDRRIAPRVERVVYASIPRLGKATSPVLWPIVAKRLRRPRSHVVAVGSDAGRKPGNTAEAPDMTEVWYVPQRSKGRTPRRDLWGFADCFPRPPSIPSVQKVARDTRAFSTNA